MTMKLYYEKDVKRITTDATIAHYGIKGMRWGVRRTDAQLGHKPSGGRVKKIAKKIAPMDIEGMKKDPVLNAAARAAKRTGQFGKYMVTPQTDQLKGDIAGAKAKGARFLSKLHQREVREATKLAADYDKGAKDVSAGTNKMFLKKNASQLEARVRVLKETAKDSSVNPVEVKRLSKQAQKLQAKADKMKSGNKIEAAFFKEASRDLKQYAKESAARAKKWEQKAQEYEAQSKAHHTKQKKRNYGFGYGKKDKRTG